MGDVVMTKKRMNALLKFYGQHLKGYQITPFRFADHDMPVSLHGCPRVAVASHVVYMCQEATTFSDAQRKMRWLGFVQGALFVHGWFTLNQLKAHVTAHLLPKGEGDCILGECDRPKHTVNDPQTPFCRRHQPRPARVSTR